MNSRKPRLNPFLFPPDTNFRFVLLLVSVLGASLFAYYTLHTQFYAKQFFAVWSECLSDANAAFPLEGLQSGSQEYVDQSFLNTQFNNNCNEPLEQTQARWIATGLGALLLVASLVYWFLPAWRIRRDKLTVFSSEDDPDIHAYLLSLCQEAGLRKTPVFMLRALNPSPSGLAFGHLGRYYVVLNGGLVTLFYQDRSRFRAIVLHELAHIRNQDIDKTYFSLAIVIAFLLATLIPLVLGNIASLLRDFGANIGYVLWQSFAALIYIPTIYLVFASILRSRELYADARVLADHPQNQELRNELVSLTASKNPVSAGILSLHPDPAWRVKAFDEPHLLFGLNTWDAFLAGFISTFALGELDNFLSILVPPQFESFALLGASLFFIPLITSVVGVGVWQKVFAGQIRSQESRGFGRYGLSLGLGMLLGMFLSFSSFIEASISVTASSFLWVAVFEMLFGTLFLVSLFLFFRWVAIGAAVWLETVTDPASLRRVTSFGLLVTGLALSFWTGGYYLLRTFGYELVLPFALSLIPFPQRVPGFEHLRLSLFTESIVGYLIIAPILLTSPVLLSIILWVFPLLSGFRRSRIHIRNIFLDGADTVDVPSQTHPHLRPLAAFLTGLIVGIGFILVAAVVRIVMHIVVDEAVRTTAQWSFNFKIAQIVLAILTQIVLASIVSLSFKRLGWAHGLWAAFIVGCVIAPGLLMLVELSDCIAILRLGTQYSCSNFLEEDISFWVGPIIILGGFYSLLPAFFMSWIGSWFRSQFARTSAHVTAKL